MHSARSFATRSTYHSELPKDIAPKMTLEIFNPEFPNRVYSILGLSFEALLIGEAVMSFVVCIGETSGQFNQVEGQRAESYELNLGQ